MSTFKYFSDEINKMIDESKLTEVCMSGTKRELESLKTDIEKFFDEKIFYLSYWKSECAFHGWEWSKDDGRMKNQVNITDGITDKFKELYALILAGLGEKCEEEEKKVNELGETDLEIEIDGQKYSVIIEWKPEEENEKEENK